MSGFPEIRNSGYPDITDIRIAGYPDIRISVDLTIYRHSLLKDILLDEAFQRLIIGSNNILVVDDNDRASDEPRIIQHQRDQLVIITGLRCDVEVLCSGTPPREKI